MEKCGSSSGRPLGGYALDTIGVAALAIGATAIVGAPVLWIVPRWSANAPEAA